MTDDNVFKLNKPDQGDLLQEVLREGKGARKMLAAAIEAEVSTFIERHGLLETAEGKSAVVRNGYLPKQWIQTGLGDIEVKVPKIRDRSNFGIKFNSSLVPPYLKRAKNIEEFLPWLYLRGISTGDFSETLKHLWGWIQQEKCGWFECILEILDGKSECARIFFKTLEPPEGITICIFIR